MEDNNTLPLDINPTPENKSIIKIIGVGGGGQNAASHMYNCGITDVTYLAINSDEQALKNCGIIDQLQIGPDGLGCGADPEKGKQYAIASEEQIKAKLNDGTKMVFITAGMGGGTGTGASPEVARVAKELGILTVGIVTIPFKFEGRRKILKAYDGISRIKPYCDALLIVNNMKLIKLFKDDTMEVAFKKADDVLAVAAKSISDIITKPAYMNVDFHDVEATLSNGGVALISTGVGRGENRMQDAINAAVTSPLLQNNNIGDSKHLLFELCMSHEHSANMDELDKLNDFVDGFSNKDDIEVIWGALYDDTLGDEVRIIILASGFAYNADDGTVISGKGSQVLAPELQPVAPEPLPVVPEPQPEPEPVPEPEPEPEPELEPEPIPDSEPEPSKEKQPVAEIKPAAPARTVEEMQAAFEIKKREEARKSAEAAAAAAKAEQARKDEETRKAEERRLAAEAAAKAEEERKAAAAAAQAAVKVQVPVTPVSAPAPASAPAKDPLAASLADEDYKRKFIDIYGPDEWQKECIKSSRKNYFIFTNDELKSKAIADELENTPAYLRKAEDLSRVRNKKEVVVTQSLFG